MRIEMNHLSGFWSSENWADYKYTEYLRRHKPFKDYWDQVGHRWLGRVMSRSKWEARERKQWDRKPSHPRGSYDAAKDHYNWLRGKWWSRKRRHEAAVFRIRVNQRRPRFL